MPERIVETEFVKMTQPGDEKMNSMDDSDKLYCQKRPETLSLQTVDLMTREGAAASVDTKLTIVGEKDAVSIRPRCSPWMLWLKFSSLLYLIVILMLVLWALHQYKKTQAEEESLNRLPVQPSALKSALRDISGQQSSKALLHYSRPQPGREPEIIEWEKLPASYLTGNDITYKDGRYYVNSSGYYEVQCRLQFDTYSLHKVPTQDVHVVFSVIRQTGPESSKNLMSDTTTLRPREYRGIQLGPTVFYLEDGDSVYVSLQQQQQEFVNPTVDNYFAMRKIE